MLHPIKIAYVLHSLGIGGLENGVVNLLNHLPGDRYAFTLITLGDDKTLLPRVRRPDLEHLTIGKRWGNDALLPMRLAAALRRIRPDIVHTRNWSTIEGVLAGRIARVPTVIHGEHGLNADEAGRMKVRRVAARRVLFRMADRIITVSQSIRDGLIARTGVRPDKVVTVKNGVDTDLFRPGRGEASARRVFGAGREDVVIGAVGRLDPVKDHATLIHAFALLARSRPALRLVLIGDGPEGRTLRRLAESLSVADQVVFAGAMDGLEDIYPALDVFALPSLTEGMSNTLLEAMAAGLPCVATRVGGNSEVVRDGETGRLVPPGDPEALAAALVDLVDGRELRRAFGVAGRLRVESGFRLADMASSYDRLYRFLANRSSQIAGGIPKSIRAAAERAATPPL